jgi:hypothetical protein
MEERVYHGAAYPFAVKALGETACDLRRFLEPIPTLDEVGEAPRSDQNQPVREAAGEGKPDRDTLPGGGRGGDVDGRPFNVNIDNRTTVMGDVNLRESPVTTGSSIDRSFNRTRDDHSTKGATGGVWKWLSSGLWSFVKKRFGW